MKHEEFKIAEARFIAATVLQAKKPDRRLLHEAVTFTTLAAIAMGHDVEKMQALERESVAMIDRLFTPELLGQPIYDVERVLVALIYAGCVFSERRVKNPRLAREKLLVAAVAFAIQIAVEADQPPGLLRDLEQRLIAVLEEEGSS